MQQSEQFQCAHENAELQSSCSQNFEQRTSAVAGARPPCRTRKTTILAATDVTVRTILWPPCTVRRLANFSAHEAKRLEVVAHGLPFLNDDTTQRSTFAW